jgi:hypothetical protein
MIDRTRVITLAQMSDGTVPFSRRTIGVTRPCTPAGLSEVPFTQFVGPTRLIVPSTATVKRSLWVVRSQKLILPKD